MEASKTCIKPPRKGKKKKEKRTNRLVDSLSEIAEEFIDFPLDDKTCQDAASVVVSDITESILIPSSINFTEKRLPETEKSNDSNISIKPHEIPQNEQKDTAFEEQVDAFSKIVKADLNKSQIDEKNKLIVCPKYPSSKVETENRKLVLEPFSDGETIRSATESASHETHSIPDTPNEFDWNIENIKENVNVQAEEASDSKILKPSVFVAKGRPYSSSLEIGYQWDRRKYNPVLLPDLSKVVYPDLDSFFARIPNSRVQGAQKINYDDILYKICEEEKEIAERLVIDRHTKPRLNAHADNGRVLKEMNQSTNKPASQSDDKRDIVPIKNTDAHVNFETFGKVRPFVDYLLNDSQKRVRIYMNPLVWDPFENQQLVLFEVDSILYEEFFTDCNTQPGLLKAIMKRADFLLNEQLRLHTLSKGKSYAKTKEFILKNSGVLAIHGSPLKWKPKKKKQRVIFKVDDTYHEEDFVNCKSTVGLLEAIMKRAESLSKYQNELKERTIELMGELSQSNSENFDSVGTLFSGNDGRNNLDLNDFGEQIESLNGVTFGSIQNISNDPPHGTRNFFTTMRNLWKGTFGKKSAKHKESEPALGTEALTDTENSTSSESFVFPSDQVIDSISYDLPLSENVLVHPESVDFYPNLHPLSQDVPRKPDRITFGSLFRKK
ncbi:unnamed protein product [Orchesella dallaii]|uniref:Uncharacterized protein n=1 Tax=Orchesella dallaii TaxID=48710 RepID=A0ABP1RF49_9HEXA